MQRSWKFQLARFFIAKMKLSKLIVKLYPVAIDAHYSNISRNKLDEIRNLFVLEIDQYSSFIRVGDDNDGGYVLENDINQKDVCLSFGIGSNYSFDSAMSKLCSEVRMFDHTIQEPKPLFTNMKFSALGLASESKINYVTLSEILHQIHPDDDIILKIDIEGDEWEILNGLSRQNLLRFKQIVIELHGIHEIADEVKFRKIVGALKNLNQTHSLKNLHANNWANIEIIRGIATPDVVEATYARRKEEVFQSTQTVDILSELNQPNNGNLPDDQISFISKLRINAFTP